MIYFNKGSNFARLIKFDLSCNMFPLYIYIYMSIDFQLKKKKSLLVNENQKRNYKKLDVTIVPVG